jgi:transcriptional regulator with PAS, ATPase and Fis domain
MNHTTRHSGVKELPAETDPLPLAVEPCHADRGLCGGLGFHDLVGASLLMQRLHEVITKMSLHRYRVLILGETGTGKEIVARSIHFSGPRARKPFVPVDCAALTDTLIESELFGHTKGAFTGATHSHRGLFEAANEGTLFLDEIGELPLHLQAKLLRAIQEGEIKPVGSTERTAIDVRVIAATNRNLEEGCRNGTFRQDLYFRLNVVQIKLPPLRERKTDIPLLANHFLQKFSALHASVCTISEDALRRLTSYDWPGNVRELENVIERALALGSSLIINVGDLPSEIQHVPAERIPNRDQGDEVMPLEELERRAIVRTLRQTGGDRVAAARALGIGKTTLYRKLKTISHGPARV